MTEQEWLTCNDPGLMLQFLLDRGTSERKLRLLECACCRLIWEFLPDPRSRTAVEVAERYADELATPRDLGNARAAALAASDNSTRKAGWAVYWTATVKASGPLLNVFDIAAAAPVRHAMRHRPGRQDAIWDAVHTESARAQLTVIREVIGNPFRSIPFNPDWLAWEGGTVEQMARGIYDEAAFDRLPVLGDALEEAGCTEQTVLAHFRAGQRHFRGCWALDWVLGRG